MVKPFIKVTKDFYKRGDNELYAFKYLGESHTFFLMLTLAEYTGTKRGTVTTSIDELAAKACVTKAKMNQWIRTLKDKGLISTQRINKTDVLVTISNFDVYNGGNTYSPHNDTIDIDTQDVELVELVEPQKDEKTIENLQPNDRHTLFVNDSNNLQASKNKEYRTKNSTYYSSVPLINFSTSTKEKEKINKKEKVAAEAPTAAAKKSKARRSSISDVESNLDTEYVEFADTIGFDPRYIHTEFDKWIDWQDSKGKRFSDNKMAFKNWLRNAVKFQGQHTTPSLNTDDIRRLN